MALSSFKAQEDPGNRNWQRMARRIRDKGPGSEHTASQLACLAWHFALSMDVYISEEYVAKRRAEKRAAAAAAAARMAGGDGEDGKARGGGGGGDSRRTRWTAAWADGSEKGKGSPGHVVGAVASGREDDVILSYFSA
uniref:Uncharacterized protein n=6 Tax=Oryza TaxID=4527 RepID=Q9FVY2_ORYSJ|nr:hypothetical protein [Oryza sativa Japonica Group]